MLGQAAGYYRVMDKLVYATVKGAGHEVPLFQPLESLTMITRFFKTGSLAESKEEAMFANVDTGSINVPRRKQQPYERIYRDAGEL